MHKGLVPMTLELLPDCIFLGPALPEPFVRLELEAALTKESLLPRNSGDEGRKLNERWEVYRRKLRELTVRGGPERVRNHVIEPLIERLGYAHLEDGGQIQTNLDLEDGGMLLVSADRTSRLRAWTTDLGTDLDAPAQRGTAYRYSPARIVERVLHTTGERLALLTNGIELRLLIYDPARRESQIIIPIDQLWMERGVRGVPDSYRLLLALASPAGVQFLPKLFDQARLQQTRVTKELRDQARQAVESFIQEVLDHPENTATLAAYADKTVLARQLWREGLVIIYRLLFVLKLESSDDPARRFSFADASLWRNSYSPGYALAAQARRVLDTGADTGRLLENGLKATFRMLAGGVEFPALTVKPLLGGLFNEASTPILKDLRWGERAVALLLDRLLWTSRKRGSTARERVYYGPLEVEELGRVYEALLELEPGIAAEPMCRLRRQKLEVVVPLAQGEKYRTSPVARHTDETDEDADDTDEDAEETPARGKKTKVDWREAIAPGRFYLRVGLGRKATGSYYTPDTFVRFLVKETLGPQCDERSPEHDPQPTRILALKVLDPATGSGHFLVGACRFLGDRLYEACYRCDELAMKAERQAEQAKDADDRAVLQARAVELRRRIEALPDPDNALLAYLPSRAAEGDQPGVSERKARALCRRLVAVHCLYGVDKNPLAIELAKLALWIEAHAEGLPLTFLDHRLVVGDSLTGPFFEHLLHFPHSQQPLNDLFNQGLHDRFAAALDTALGCVQTLQESVGIDEADITRKHMAKERFDQSLAPFRLVAAAWAGGVMLGEHGCDDDAYAWLVQQVVTSRDVPAEIDAAPRLARMVARGLGLPVETSWDTILHAFANTTRIIPALPYDLTFPEVFFPDRSLTGRRGFDTVVGNPPWDGVRPKAKEFFATFDFKILEAPTKRERESLERHLKNKLHIATLHKQYEEGFEEQHRIHDRIYRFQVVKIQGEKTSGDPDLAKLFTERNTQLINNHGFTGFITPSAFHANEGATGIRQLYLEQLSLNYYYSFENKYKLFDIHTSFKFAPIVATRSGSTTGFPCAFYLHNDTWLYDQKGRAPLRYTLDFIRSTGGEYLSLIELRSPKDVEVVQVCFSNGWSFIRTCEHLNIRLGRELHMTDDAWRFIPCQQILSTEEDSRKPETALVLLCRGIITLFEGKNINTFNDRWSFRPSYLLPLENVKSREKWLFSPRYYRIAMRKIQNSQNERTFTMTLLPAGWLSGDSIFAEQNASERPNWKALTLTSYCSSYISDWLLRQFVTANVNLFIVNRIPLPWKDNLALFLTHCALRLTCNHAGYAALWREQVGDVWREERAPFDWPVLAGDDARWRVRAAIDAVVADAYGLSREQYAHVLSTFSHKSYPQAPALCLAAYDELKQIGLEAFTQRHDPYWDIPLNQNLPQPVIELPALAPATDEPKPAQQVLDFGEAVAALRNKPATAKRAAEHRASYTTESAETMPLPVGDQTLQDNTDHREHHTVILARFVQLHEGTPFKLTLGRVKAEKFAHLVENHLGVPLGRKPVKDAAGPVDFQHLLKTVDHARRLGAFNEVKRPGTIDGYLFLPLPKLISVGSRMDGMFGDKAAQIEKLAQSLVGLKSRQVELIATLYSVWNELIQDGRPITDELLLERVHAWHPDKRTFDLGEVRVLKAWMVGENIVPTGDAPRVPPRTGNPLSTSNRVTLASLSETESALYDRLKALLAKQVVITSSSVQETLGLDAATVRPLLKRLVDEGLARQEGERRGTRYRKL